MQKIIPFIWFPQEAEEAAKFYVSVFKNSKLGKASRYDEVSSKAAGMKNGEVMVMPFSINGFEIQALNGGPIFKPTPAISFTVFCEANEIDPLWKKLSDGGKVLMELQKYPFAEKYGWLNDKYGVSWQLIIGKGKQPVVPSLMFTQKVAGRAEEAINFYMSIFRNSKIEMMVHYDKDSKEPATSVEHSLFQLDGEQFIAMDSSAPHDFTFTEGNSLMVNCADQEEIDRLWDRLTDGGMEVQCGWLKDKFGVSWQIVPAEMGRFSTGDPESVKRAMGAILKMKKIDIREMKKAYDGN